MHSFDITLENLSKIEGHADLEVRVREGRVTDVKFEITENQRFYEQAVRGQSVLGAPQLFVSPGMLDFVLVYALAAAILGGLDSPLGAVVAAWFIGVIENLAGAYIDVIGNDLKIAVPFLVMIIILIVRPQGLFGRKVVVRV